MQAFLLLGFLVGMQHAMEADHLVAVSTMIADDRDSQRSAVWRGVAWGIGHTITLFAICSVVMIAGLTITDELGSALEFGVGVMLVLLGLDVLRRLRARRIHFHVHTHENGESHMHVHSHESQPRKHMVQREHKREPHHHRHGQKLPRRALLVGLVHGAAGSAGLLALAVAATGSTMLALSYGALFGIGSIIGMAFLSVIVAWPMRIAERQAKWMHNGIAVGAAALTIMIGVALMVSTGSALQALLV